MRRLTNQNTKSNMISRRSSTTYSAGWWMAAWLVVGLSMPIIIADPTEVSTNSGPVEPQAAELLTAASPEPVAATPAGPEPTNGPSVAPGDFGTGVAALASGRPSAGPESDREPVNRSQTTGVLSNSRTNPTVLCLVLSCGALLVASGWVVRRLQKVSRKLQHANSQVERRTQELASSNEQLKREIAERHRQVAERQLTENALRASENFYYSLVETVPQNIFRKDLAGKYTFANRAFSATLARSAVDIIGRTDQDLFPTELAARFRREDEQLLAACKQSESEQYYPTASGEKICVKMIKTPLLDSDGRPMGIQGVFWDLYEQKRAEKELLTTHHELVKASRRVGMAEVATGVLHNVGNVLNSVNVSATLVCDQVKKSKVLAVGKVAALLSAHADDPGFLIGDERGKQVPGYLKDLAEHLRKEQTAVLAELYSLIKNIEHIKETVVMQQDYAKLCGLSVTVKTSDIGEDHLRINSSALTRHEGRVVREYQDDPTIIVDKHTTLQI